MNRGAPAARKGRTGRGRGASLTARPVISTSGDEPTTFTDSSTPYSFPVVKTDPGTSRSTWGSKFKPKNVRRSEAERAVIAEQEAQKDRERAAEEAKSRPRGRFRGGRSRGNAMGQRGRPGNATNMFSQRRGPENRAKSIEDTRISGESTNSQYESREPRINADKLGMPAGTTDPDNEDNFDFYDEDEKCLGLRPMGIYRTKPKKEGLAVMTSAEIDAQAHASESSDEEINFKAAISSAKSKEFKGPDVAVSDPGSKEINFEGGRKEEGNEDDFMDADEIVITTTRIPKKSVLPVDLEEEQLNADLKLMRNEFAHVKIHESYDDQEKEPDEEKIAEEGIPREGRVYLFQFPPVMPPLRPIKKAPLKTDPDAIMDNSNLTNAALEDEVEASDDESANISPENQSGFVGQMIVRKSGHVEMNWGGITYEMRPALKRDFVTSAVLVDYSDDKRPHHRRHHEETHTDGRVIGLGKVMGQFILAPKYEDISEWAIREEDLQVISQ